MCTSLVSELIAGIQLPAQIIFPFIQAAIIYWIVGLSMVHWYSFPVFATTMILLSMCGTSLGILFASLFPDIQVALAVFPIAFLPLMLFSGVQMTVDRLNLSHYLCNTSFLQSYILVIRQQRIDPRLL